MDAIARRRLYNLCAPDEPLAMGDPRWVDLDASPTNPRGRRWSDFLAVQIERSTRPACLLFTGLPGSGVTTELSHLAAHLGDPRGANLFVVHIHTERTMDLAKPLRESELLAMLLRQTRTALVERGAVEGRDVLARWSGWMPHTDSSRLTRAIQDELVILTEQARRAGHSGLAVLCDGLGQLPLPRATLAQALDDIERLFVQTAAAMSLPIHVVWTVPYPLTLRLPAEVLPMLALENRRGLRRDAAYATAVEVIRRRIGEDGLRDVFGLDAWPARVERLIVSSGGNPRELVAALRDCIAEPTLDDARLSEILAWRGERWQRGVDERWLAFLSCVSREKNLPSPEQRALAERVLAEGLVWRYEDDRPWYDLPPALRALPNIASC